ncbi:hypothetical protein C9426_33180 [Serratia sp. S1B]|nr:hypothetical protein C9426_33180 [Serratia sp. S1B]
MVVYLNNNVKMPSMKVKKLLIALGLFSWASQVYAEPGATTSQEPKTAASEDTVTFNNAFLMGNQALDLSGFENGNPQLPGTYDVDIYLNNQNIAHEKIVFKLFGEEKHRARPCFTQTQLEQFGVDMSKVASQADVDACLPMESWLPQASARYDVNQQKLVIVVPQAQMHKFAQGYVSSKSWDEGITAGILAYSLNGFTNHSPTGNNSSGFMSLNSSMNLGLWRLHYNSSTRVAQGGGMNWQHINAYAARPIASLESQVVLGEGNTSGELFDSIPFRGMQLASDERMLPESQRGYAPVIRGTANSNAKVEIWQGNFLLYQTTVTPGPFEINDVTPTGYGEDLRVVVTEANNSKQEFTVPFASVPQLLRPGRTRYSVTAGQVRMDNVDNANMVQGGLQRGLNNNITGYTGVQASRGYTSGIVGAAVSTPIGAFSADVSHAVTSLLQDISSSGQSWRVGYSKVFPQTETNIALAQYRYSSSGYYTLTQALQYKSQPEFDDETGVTQQFIRPRSQSSITISQSLGYWGNFYLLASANQYWGNQKSDSQYQAGFSRNFGSLAVTVSANRNTNGDGQKSNQYFVSLTMPLGNGLRAPTLAANMNFDQGNNSQQLYLNGSVDEANTLGYGASVSRSSLQQTTMGVNGLYQGPYAQTNASYTQGSDYRSASAGVNGAMVIHSGGITFSQQAAETMVLIEAKGADGAQVSSGSNILIDRNGYALVPYVIPYRMNSIDLSPAGVDQNLEFESTSKKVAPYAGSVVKVKFDTRVSRMVLIDALDDKQGKLPFGATVFDDKGQNKGMVAQASQLYLRDIEDKGRLWVRWDDATGKHECYIDYDLPVSKDKKSFTQLNGICVLATSAKG